MKSIKNERALRRKRRVSMNIRGNADRPRISVYRSNRFIYAQAIDDDKKVTVAAISSRALQQAEKSKQKKSEAAKNVGLALAEKLKEKKVATAVMDRGIYVYKGRVRALAEGLREGGIII